MSPVAALHVSKRLLVVLALAAAAVPWVFAARMLMHPTPVTTPRTSAPPHSIVWAHRVFTSPADLAAWLKSRGMTYRLWAARYPVDAAILEQRPIPAPPPRPAAKARGTHWPSVTWAGVRTWLSRAVALLLALAAVALLVGVIAPSLRPQLLTRQRTELRGETTIFTLAVLVACLFYLAASGAA